MLIATASCSGMVMAMSDSEQMVGRLTDDDIRCPDCHDPECYKLPNEVKAVDVAAAVQWLRDEIQHTEDDWEQERPGSRSMCKHCGQIKYPKRMGGYKAKICPVKVEEKLGEAFGAVLNNDDADNQEGGSSMGFHDLTREGLVDIAETTDDPEKAVLANTLVQVYDNVGRIKAWIEEQDPEAFHDE